MKHFKARLTWGEDDNTSPLVSGAGYYVVIPNNLYNEICNRLLDEKLLDKLCKLPACSVHNIAQNDLEHKNDL